MLAYFGPSRKAVVAALDVFEREPDVPEALMRDRRFVLAPHIGSGTEETRRATAENVVDALAKHFGIEGPRNPTAIRAELERAGSNSRPLSIADH
ncbi:D-isomer specific 2-hydroxyacid dehydrogenase [Caballeronia glebae]|uniref:D-isomer specific 2-hydroxyacid dehydrogenase n=1 Tax=Caballeronia glebae TaxID=1777143 RepID=A0A158BPW6_9BURK|nr:hypothetical protein [Caballeronia glebae]SAK71766.1 D-isomer specific 2-hydroxyacid dehydrogenase [Caballeronia glebae]